MTVQERIFNSSFRGHSSNDVLLFYTSQVKVNVFIAKNEV